MIDLRIEMNARDGAQVARSLAAFLDEYTARMRFIRVRLFRAGRRGMVRCKIRAWQDTEPTIVVSAARSTIDEAVVEAAESFERMIGRRNTRANELAERRRIQKASRRLRARLGRSP